MDDVKFNKRELLKYVGDMSQLFGVKDYFINGGKADGVRAVDIRNGSGLEFTVIPDRAMDIAHFSYKGLNFSYISSTGIVAPQYFSNTGIDFLRSFFAGFLTTCGLRNVGSPCTDQGEDFGLHGRISNTPAEQVYAGIEYEDRLPVMKVKGQVREARFFGENIFLCREISAKYGEKCVHINDTIENNGFKDEPLMILYHFNLGYPLLCEESYLITPSNCVTPRDKEAQKGIGEYKVFQAPTHGYSEQVFYHDLKADDKNKTFAALVNPSKEVGIAIRFDKSQLCRLTQWKQMGEGEYVLGLEPSNCHVEGRAKAREDGSLEFIKPGEIRRFDIEIQVLDGIDEINKLSEQSK